MSMSGLILAEKQSLKQRAGKPAIPVVHVICRTMERFASVLIMNMRTETTGNAMCVGSAKQLAHNLKVRMRLM